MAILPLSIKVKTITVYLDRGYKCYACICDEKNIHTNVLLSTRLNHYMYLV